MWAMSNENHRQSKVKGSDGVRSPSWLGSGATSLGSCGSGGSGLLGGGASIAGATCTRRLLVDASGRKASCGNEASMSRAKVSPLHASGRRGAPCRREASQRPGLVLVGGLMGGLGLGGGGPLLVTAVARVLTARHFSYALAPARSGDKVRSGEKARSGDKVCDDERGDGCTGLALRARAGSSAEGRIGESLPVGVMRRGETKWKRHDVELTAGLAAGARRCVEVHAVRVVRRLRGEAPEWSIYNRRRTLEGNSITGRRRPKAGRSVRTRHQKLNPFWFKEFLDHRERDPHLAGTSPPFLSRAAVCTLLVLRC